MNPPDQPDDYESNVPFNSNPAARIYETGKIDQPASDTPRTDAGTEISNNLHSCGIISARDIERVAMQINNNRGFVKMSDYEGQVGKKQEALQRIIGLIKELTAAQQQIEELKRGNGEAIRVKEELAVRWQGISDLLTLKNKELSQAANQIAALREVQWIVNDIGELGIKQGSRFLFLYKGDSLEYEEATHDDGTPMFYRMVGKREFGETCHPLNYFQDGKAPARYSATLVYREGLSDGKKEDGDWKPLPKANSTAFPAYIKLSDLEPVREALKHWKDYYENEIQSCDDKARKLKEEGDTHGMNFYQGRRSGLIQHDLGLSKLKQLDSALATLTKLGETK